MVLVAVPEERNIRGIVSQVVLQSEWLHLKGKPEVQREAVIDKIRPYLDTKEIQEDLEDDEIAMVDGDEESTDPYVEATDILERIHLITC